jgi:hypothetical protein
VYYIDSSNYHRVALWEHASLASGLEGILCLTCIILSESHLVLLAVSFPVIFLFILLVLGVWVLSLGYPFLHSYSPLLNLIIIIAGIGMLIPLY